MSRILSEYRIIHGAACELPDVAAFIATLNTLDTQPVQEARGLFDGQGELIVARAPGRLDVMGGIADYSGSLVLQWPIREATFAALQHDSEPKLTLVSLAQDAARETRFEMPLADFYSNGEPITYDAAREYFRRNPARHWAAYAAGAWLVLLRERGFAPAQGARLLISSQVPEGKGVSSSAAVEVAVLSAVAAAFDLNISPRELALLCQQVENLVVGAPCGVMDQLTSVCGAAQQLLALLCQPAELQGTVALPTDLAVWGLDSGVRHSVGGGDYGSVRIGAFMGYRIIAELAGLKSSRQSNSELVCIDDPHWRGFLANVTPAEFEQRFAARLPEQMAGSEFLAHYAGTTDAVTRIDPARSYAVRVPTAHPVHEHFRVRLFAELLGAPPGERRNQLLGELMCQSHASYSACGLGSEGTDLLVQLVRAEGVGNGLYGAKITGGGSGGTVAVLGHCEAAAAVQRVAEKYAEVTGHQPYIFFGSSPGSAAFGHLRLDRVLS
jgi:galactokinase